MDLDSIPFIMWACCVFIGGGMALVGAFVPAGFARWGNILLWVVLRGGVAFLALLSWIGYKLWWLMVLPHAIVVDLVIDVVTSMGVMPRFVCQFADYKRFAVAKCATVCSVALLGSCAAIDAIDGGVCVCVPLASGRVRGVSYSLRDMCAVVRVALLYTMCVLECLVQCARFIWDHPRVFCVAYFSLPVLKKLCR